MSQIPSLAKVYQDYFHIGAAVNTKTIQTAEQLLATQFNSITAENDMKFALVHPEKDLYTFENADKILAFAKKHNMHMRGHTLVWHNQTTDWVFEDGDKPASRELLLERMKQHIDTVVGRYKGDIYCWDVVNEVIDDKNGQFLRDSKWLSQVGEDFIAKAFHFAHEADPNALLFYNDYNESTPEKRDKIVKLIKGLKADGVPIHGMGLQGHWNLNTATLDNIKAAIEAYAALDVVLHVTELDISVFDHEDERKDLTAPTAEMLEKQAVRYEQIFKLFREYKDHVKSVTFWGAGEDYTWLDNFPVVGRKNWPFVFDEKHQPKSSFWNIAKW